MAAAQTPPKTPQKTGTTPSKSGVTRHSLYNPSSLKDKAPEQFQARFTTTKGDFVLEITRAMAPLGVDRFYNLVKYGYYNGAALYRVVPGFVVQFGASPTPAVNAAWENAKIKDEPVQGSNVKGAISFAAAGPNTRTTEVFINLVDNVRLDGMGFASFGKIVDGMDTVEKLYSGYGNETLQFQDQISKQGAAFIKSKFPELDTITKAVIVGPAAPAPPAKK